jgi:predicted dehydrogenase
MGDTPKESLFLPSRLVRQVNQNAKQFPQIAKMREEIIAQAQPWLSFTDNQLWEMMFAPTIKRSWMVWSNGHCPSCKQSVPMYTWLIDPFAHRWKVTCPHCKDQFPKNDFEKFYRSGIDSQGLFDPKRADRSLLFNQSHPDPKDPLHKFGVDDGEGFVEGDHRWRFIGAYLIYGEWKQLIVGGIVRLSAAYAVTGDKRYAHKAGILLDRVADVYPLHDFGKQGVMYEGAPRSGYVSTWHDACIETRQIALAYDMVHGALERDRALVTFLRAKAKQVTLPAPKTTTVEILANIERGLLQHPQENLDRIYCNYPQTEMTVAILKSVQNWEKNRNEVQKIFREVLTKSTAVDGVTGEKGLTGYAVFATSNIANVLALYARTEPKFLEELIQQHPRLYSMFRFYIDLWWRQRFYPAIGDCSSFGSPLTTYAALSFTQNPGIAPSMYSFLWEMYRVTKDAAFVQALYATNGGKADGLPYDMYETDPKGFQAKVKEVILREGAYTTPPSVNKQEWHLAMLRSGTGENERALWIDYDSGGYHSHADGMNIGLFAYGLDLLPDFGYPPVQFGGWDAPRSRWYMNTAAHNTVMVDEKNQRNKAGERAEGSGYKGLPAGETKLWIDGKGFRSMRVEGREMVERAAQYERHVAMVDISADSSYVLDLFRVIGGESHTRALHSTFGTITTQGIDPKTSPSLPSTWQVRHAKQDANPKMGWSVDWKIEDRRKVNTNPRDIHLRLTDLTEGAKACLAESWIAPNGYSGDDGEWIPTVFTSNNARSTQFVSILEPYEKSPNVLEAKRLFVTGNPGDLAVQVRLIQGDTDLFLLRDTVNPIAHTRISTTPSPYAYQSDHKALLQGEMAWVRRDKQNQIKRVVLANATRLALADFELNLVKPEASIEIEIVENEARVVWGDIRNVKSLRYEGHTLSLVNQSKSAQKEKKMIRIGLVDFDTSHVEAFTQRLNHIDVPASEFVEGAQVVMGFPGDSEIMPERIPGYEAKLRKYGIRIVNKPEEMIGHIDAVMIESQQGKRHLERAEQFFKAKIPVYVDKPFAGSVEEAEKMIALAEKYGVPLLSCSSLRYDPKVKEALELQSKYGKLLSADVWGPCELHPGNPGLLHYGIHGVELLYALMGAGCEKVQMMSTPEGEVVTGTWKSGHVGTVRGIRKGQYGFGFVAHYEKGNVPFVIEGAAFYREMLKVIVEMFQTGKPPVDYKVMREIMAFIHAADTSRNKKGTIERVR